MARIKKTDKEKLKRGGDQTGDGAKTAQHGVNRPRERGAGARTRRRVEKAGHVPSTAEFLQQAINRQEAKLRQQAIDRRGTQAGAPPPMLTPNHPRSMGEKDAAAFQQKQDTALANRSVPPEVQQQLDQSQASIAEHKRQQELLDRQTAQINRRMGQVQEGLTPAGTSGFAIPPGDRQLARDAGLNVRYGMVGGQADLGQAFAALGQCGGTGFVNQHDPMFAGHIGQGNPASAPGSKPMPRMAVTPAAAKRSLNRHS